MINTLSRVIAQTIWLLYRLRFISQAHMSRWAWHWGYIVQFYMIGEKVQPMRLIRRETDREVISNSRSWFTYEIK